MSIYTLIFVYIHLHVLPQGEIDVRIDIYLAYAMGLLVALPSDSID